MAEKEEDKKESDDKKAKLHIGDIVATKPHPYFKDDIEHLGKGTYIPTLLASDSDFIPPLFVITEISKKTIDKEKFDPTTGFPKLTGWEYKCVYFSSVAKKFEERWFNEHLIVLIKSKTEVSKENKKELLGRKVILSSWRIEAAKKKTYIKETGLNTKQHNTVANLDHFPPVMIIIGLQKVVDSKNEKFNRKSGEQSYFFEKELLKCQWYNPKTSSFSESLLPEKALEFLEKEYNHEAILSLKKAIEGNKFLEFKRAEKKVFANPQRVVFNHCEYLLEYIDMLSNDTYEIPIDNSFSPKHIDRSNDYAPHLEEDITSMKAVEIATSLNQSIINFLQRDEVEYFNMNYTNRHGVKTNRTISNVRSSTEVYFSAYCYLRKEDRVFRYEGVKYITDLKFATAPAK